MKIPKAVAILRAAMSQGDCYRLFRVTSSLVKRKEAEVVIQQRTGRPPSDLLIVYEALATIMGKPKWTQVCPRLGFVLTGMPKRRFISKFFPSEPETDPWKWRCERGSGRIFLMPRYGVSLFDEHLMRVPWRVFGNGIPIAVFFTLSLLDRDNWIKHMGCVPPWEVATPPKRQRDRSFVKKK